jgi:hypothetical protein
VTAYVLKLMYPGGFVASCVDAIESILPIVTMGSLAALFINTLVKLIVDAFKSTWMGILNVAHLLAA